jgi:glycosyltransferase involved in cell wall biosynthesis
VRIVLFDWTTGGHHTRYLQRVADALRPRADVIAAVPPRTAAELVGVRLRQLTHERPQVDHSRRLGPQHKDLAAEELHLFQTVARELRPDRIIHMYGDPVLRWLVRQPPLPVPVLLVLFFVRAHYARYYQTKLSLRERARAAFQAHLIARWRRRPDAHALFCLDESAVEFLAGRGGAPTHWFPEPPVRAEWQAVARRDGCVLYGSLAPRKGLDLLAQAIRQPGTPMRIVLAGAVESGFQGQLDHLVSAMRESGSRVDLRTWHHAEDEGLTAMAHAACVVLPYLHHYGMSRVLLEAATVGTPVVVHTDGLLGYLVRRHGLGLSVDCRDPLALRRALESFGDRPAAVDRYGDALRRFASRYANATFSQALSQALHPGSSAAAGDVVPRDKEISA